MRLYFAERTRPVCSPVHLAATLQIEVGANMSQRRRRNRRADSWQYIAAENIPVVPLYFAKERPVVVRDGVLIMVDDERMPLVAG